MIIQIISGANISLIILQGGYKPLKV